MKMKIFLCVFGGIWLLVGLPFAGVGVSQMRAYRHLSTAGQPATGIVVSKVVQHGSGTRTTSASRSYRVSYRFTTSDGRAFVKYDREKPASSLWLGRDAD